MDRHQPQDTVCLRKRAALSGRWLSHDTAEHGFDVSYLLTGKRAPRYGAVDEQLIRSVFAIIETSISAAGHSMDIEKKAKLFALVYQTASETGQVDPLVAQKAIDLLS